MEDIMYKVIREKGFQDLHDSTQHIYEKSNKFPFDGREIKESRIQELATDLNKLNESIIAIESELISLSKKDIMTKFDEEGIPYDKASKKEDLIIEYEYQKSRARLLEEASEMNLEITEEMSNREIVELILNNQEL